MKSRKLRVIWTTASCLLAVVFAGYVLMDTFLIARTYQTAAEPNLPMFSSESGQSLSLQASQTAQDSEAASPPGNPGTAGRHRECGLFR